MSETRDLKHERALTMAGRRGEVAVEWFKTNKLTGKTRVEKMAEFKKLMKQTDKETKQTFNPGGG